MLTTMADKGEHGHRVIARLFLHEFEVQRPAIQAWRRARLQARNIERHLTQPRRQLVRGLIAYAAPSPFGTADQDASAEKGPYGQDNRLRQVTVTFFGDDTGHMPAVDDQVRHRRLDHVKVLLPGDDPLDCRAVKFAICLRPGCAYRRALGRVERTKLDARQVDRPGHGAAERVDFLRQMTLANAANRRVTAHLPQRLKAVRHEQDAGTRARGSQRGFRTGVSAANYDDVKALRH